MSGFRNLALIFLACTLLLSSSCAPTEDEIVTERTVQREGSPGVFLDSAVGGVDYTTTSGLGGVTDSSGRFYYNPGDQVSFTIGGISLGSVTGAAKLTPVEVMGASGTADQKVINLSRLLQTLDADGDPSNGISINDSTKTTLAAKSVNFDVSVEAFDNA
ncbi:MAG: esterase-like activity of phytase family protein, partial [bacterium]